MFYIDLCPTPYDENCAQLGDADYYEQSDIEIKAFIDQLERTVPLPDNATYVKKSNDHDFGTYYEVAIQYPKEWQLDGEVMDDLSDVENNLPERWDDKAKEFLSSNNYRHLEI